jgi:pyruvate carboxylase
MCYTGDILDPDRAKYDLKYYVNLAHELEKAGAHILGIKDMGGLMKPAAASVLVRTLREETGLPIHFHTHDTSGIAAATVLAAVEAGADAFDAAIDSMSGLTAQPCLGSLVAALADTEHATGLDGEAIRRISFYFEAVRAKYVAFESDFRAGASEVYSHEMPGGQYTNLKEQARSLGLEARWHEVARAYADANMLFGDIVKVTPSSKVVGDLALMMVASGITPADVLDPQKDVAFPDSVVQMLHGDLGQPPGGWPEALQKKALKGAAPITVRPGSLIAPADLEAERAAAAEKTEAEVDDRALASYLMYPKVYVDFAKAHDTYGPVSVLPTPVFFYGLDVGEEVPVELEKGKTLIVRAQAISEADEQGYRRVFFELNGQPRMVRIIDRAHGDAGAGARQKAEDGNPLHVAAPMPGVVSALMVKAGDVLLSIEAMKMETALHAERDGTVAEVLVRAGEQIDAKDLLVVYASQA